MQIQAPPRSVLSAPQETPGHPSPLPEEPVWVPAPPRSGQWRRSVGTCCLLRRGPSVGAPRARTCLRGSPGDDGSARRAPGPGRAPRMPAAHVFTSLSARLCSSSNARRRLTAPPCHGCGVRGAPRGAAPSPGTPAGGSRVERAESVPGAQPGPGSGARRSEPAGGGGEWACHPEGEAGRLAMRLAQDRDSAHSRHWHSAKQVTRKTTWRRWHLCWVSGPWGDFRGGAGCWGEGPPQRRKGAGPGVGPGRAQDTGAPWAQAWSV